MSNFSNHVKTVFSADTSAAKREVKSLRGVEKERAKELLNGLETQNAKLNEQITRWTKVGAVVASVAGAWKLAGASFESYVANSNLAAATQNISLEKLRGATRGLVEDTDLMRQAAALQTGVWKLNEREMERVMRAAMAIRKQTGEELLPTMQKLTESIRKGTTEELKRFGVNAKTLGGTLTQLDEISERLGGNYEMRGDQLKRANISAANSIDNLKTSIGGLVAEMGPAIQVMADFVDWARKAAGEMSDHLAGVSSATGTGAASRQLQRQLQALEFMAKNPEVTAWLRGGSAGGGMRGTQRAIEQLDHLQGMGFNRDVLEDLAQGDIQQNIDALRAQMNRGIIEEAKKSFESVNVAIVKAGTAEGFGAAAMWLEEAKQTAKKVKAKAKAARPDLDGEIDGLLGFLFGTGQAFSGAGRAFGSAAMSVYQDPRTADQKMYDFTAGKFGLQRLGQGGEADSETFLAGLRAATAGASEASEIAYAAQAMLEEQQRATLFESIFGRPSEIEATALAISAAAQAMDVFAKTSALAFEAWVTGAEGGMEAAKKFLAGAIHGMGQELAIVGAKEGVMALVSLATGNLPGAAAHGLASGAAFAGSALAFKTAQAMGHGAAQPTASSASLGGGPRALGGGGGRALGGAGNASTAAVNVFVGTDFAGLTERQRRTLLANAMARGLHVTSRTSNVRDSR